jgi:hypothetical protein
MGVRKGLMRLSKIFRTGWYGLRKYERTELTITTKIMKLANMLIIVATIFPISPLF